MRDSNRVQITKVIFFHVFMVKKDDGETIMKGRMICVMTIFSTLFFPVNNMLAAEEAPLAGLTPQEVTEMFEGSREAEWVPGQVVVKFKEDLSVGIESGEEFTISGDREITAMGFKEKAAVTSGGEVILTFTPEQFIMMSTEDSGDLTLEAVESLNQREDVEYAHPNYIFHPFLDPIDPLYAAQWHYHNNGTGPGESPGGINLPTVWDHTTGDHAVVVAVIDTGILPNHPDISGSNNLVAGFDMITSPFTANDGDGRDANPTDTGDAVTAGECGPGKPARRSSWHGTHVAGTVGVGHTNNTEGVAGVAWQVRVQSIRVLGKCGGTFVDIADAIRWAAGLSVPGIMDNATPADVINMSLGAFVVCQQIPGMQSAIDDAVGEGTTVIVAAGNDASNADRVLPAGCDGVITVAAADYNGELVTRYSNFGNVVEIMAPGGDVQADRDGDGNPDGVRSMVQGGYAFYNGTSMAAPHVAGVAALMLTHDPSLTPQQVSDALMANATSRNCTAGSSPPPSRACGAGLLNADFGWPNHSPTPNPIQSKSMPHLHRLTLIKVLMPVSSLLPLRAVCLYLAYQSI